MDISELHLIAKNYHSVLYYKIIILTMDINPRW